MPGIEKIPGLHLQPVPGGVRPDGWGVLYTFVQVPHAGLRPVSRILAPFMHCADCPGEALYRVSAYHSYSDSQPVESAHCCQDHLPATIEHFAAAYPDHRIIPVRLLPTEDTDGDPGGDPGGGPNTA